MGRHVIWRSLRREHFTSVENIQNISLKYEDLRVGRAPLVSRKVELRTKVRGFDSRLSKLGGCSQGDFGAVVRDG